MTHMCIKHSFIDTRSTFATIVRGHQNVLCVICGGFSLTCPFCFMAELLSSMDGTTRQIQQVDTLDTC